jgi:hypothetical protein
MTLPIRSALLLAAALVACGGSPTSTATAQSSLERPPACFSTCEALDSEFQNAEYTAGAVELLDQAPTIGATAYQCTTNVYEAFDEQTTYLCTDCSTCYRHAAQVQGGLWFKWNRS